MRGMNVERIEDAALQVRQWVAVRLPAHDFAENLKWGWAIGEARARRGVRSGGDSVSIVRRPRDRTASYAARQRQQIANGDAAALIVRAITVRYPRARYRQGFENHMANVLPRILPDRLIDLILASIATADYEAKAPELDLGDLNRVPAAATSD